MLSDLVKSLLFCFFPPKNKIFYKKNYFSVSKRSRFASIYLGLLILELIIGKTWP